MTSPGFDGQRDALEHLDSAVVLADIAGNQQRPDGRRGLLMPGEGAVPRSWLGSFHCCVGRCLAEGCLEPADRGGRLLAGVAPAVVAFQVVLRDG